MMGFWVSFAIIASLIPIGLFSVRFWLEKHSQLTEIQKKNANANFIKYFLFYELCDLFYMAWFLNNLACILVFGCLIMVVVLVNVCSSFTSVNSKTPFQKYSLLQDFLIGVALSVYLIYLIPDKELQTIVIAIAAAIYGGLITLAGVAWTIKKSDKDRLEDEIKREKPCFSFNPQFKEAQLSGSEKACFPPIESERKYKCEVFVQLENSDKAPFILKRLFHDGNWVDLEGNFTILPSGKCYLSFYFDSPLDIFLTVEDTLGNEYYYNLKVVSLGSLPNCSGTSTSNRALHTLREIKEISKEELLKSIKESKQQEEKSDG
ncbi:MAG TPA: hypothetical protein DD384_03100 [Firmicutes bacterium]|nr:hypothetical protein [Bacillota bacterium]